MVLWTVRADYDPDAHVWYVFDSDVPGLTGEADSLEALQKKLGPRILDMISGNAHLIADESRLQGPHEFRLVAHAEARYAIAA